jgi:hypothetical protein
MKDAKLLLIDREYVCRSSRLGSVWIKYDGSLSTDSSRVSVNGARVAEVFRLESRPKRAPTDVEILIRPRYLSLAPYTRGRMNPVKSNAREKAG